MFVSDLTVLSLSPKFKIVSIMPGIETRAPDLTDSKSGLFRSPNFFLVNFSITFISFLILDNNDLGIFFLFL